MKVYESIYWDKGTQIIYGRVLRDYDVYPDNASGNTAFYAAIAAGSLPIVDRVGPTWLSIYLTYLQSASLLQLEVVTSVGVELKLARLDGQALTGSNLEGGDRVSGLFYDYSTAGNIKQWVFGQKDDGSGGIPPVGLIATFHNKASGETYNHLFTPVNRASRTTLFAGPGTTVPVTPTVPGTATTQQIVVGNPDVFKPRVEWSGGLARIVNDAGLTVNSNEVLCVWIGGGGSLDGIPSEFTYKPGDMVQMMLAVVLRGANPNYGGTAWQKKAWANILIGPAPQN